MRNWACFAAIVVAVFSIANAQGGIIDIYVTPGEHKGPIGQDYTFVCNLDLDSGPPPDLEWRKDGVDISNGDKYVIMSMPDNAKSSTASKLTIKDAQENDGGQYECSYQNSQFGATLMVYQEYEVAIKGETILKVGEDLSFQCTVDGSPTKEVSWKKNGKPLPSDDDRYELKANNTLVIIDVVETDAGHYTCIYASPDMEFMANITVGDPLELIGPTSIKYTEGERARFECTVTSVTEPRITWTKENGTLDDRFSFDKKMKGSQYIASLLLVGVKMSDRGIYICTADNDVDVKQHEILLRVRDRLAALWPFIGIMCEVIILIAIIFIHEKCTQGNDIGEEDEDDEAMEPIKGTAGDEKPNSDGESDARLRASKE